jgi:Caspase domain
MVPVDAKLNSAADVAAQTVDVNAVIDAFKGAGNRMNIVVLDACRDNPFRGNTAAGKGLAQVDAPPGTFLAYATAPGNVAEDGDVKSGNGLYTQYLLQELKKPTAKIEDVFKRVRLNVRKQSEGRQIPWESTSLEDDFFFNDGKVVAVAKLSDSVKESAFNVEKADWDKIKDSKKADDFYAFLLKFPNGFISEAALGKLNQLSQNKVIAGLAKDQVVANVRSNERFQLNDKYYLVRKDGFSKAERRRWTSSVTAINEGIVDVDGGKTKLTTSGATVRFQAGGTQLDFDPPLNTLPAGDFQVGSKWQTRTTMALFLGIKGWIEQDLKVVGREKLTNEAGTFDAFKVEMRGWTFQNQKIEVKYWVDPNFGFPIRLEFLSKNNSGGVLQYYVDEWYQKPDRVQGKS